MTEKSVKQLKSLEIFTDGSAMFGQIYAIKNRQNLAHLKTKKIMKISGIEKSLYKSSANKTNLISFFEHSQNK